VVTNAAREGARLAVIQGSKEADIRTRVKEYLTNGGLKEPMGDEKIIVKRTEPLTGTDTASVVQVNYPFNFMVLNPVIRLIAPGDSTGKDQITMTSSAKMRNEI
jgi:hypothetical protein